MRRTLTAILLTLLLPGPAREAGAESAQPRQEEDAADWYPFEPPSDPQSTTFDLSFLNERPAGEHGHVVVRDGRFVFEDGTPARFWGTNLVASHCFPTHDQAERTARRLARLGVNLVRLHHMDAPWSSPNIFDPAFDDTQHLSAESLDRLDYLIAALKQNGIYVFPDLLVHRQFRAGDGVPDYQQLELGAKGVAHFSRRVIELNKLYATMLLTHRNPYTGQTLAEDPVMVCTEVVNESSIFSGFGLQDFPPAFEAELQAMFEVLGGSGPITRFAYDWGSRSLIAVRNPESWQKSLEVLSALEESSNLEMRAHLDSLGVRALLTGSNIGLPILAEVRANARLDFVDTHFYWDHPRVWEMPNEWADIDRAPFDNLSQIVRAFDSMIPALSEWRVAGLPLTVSEWNHCFPNEWRLEGPVLAAAYGSLQGWDAMLQFDFAEAPIGHVKMTPFDIDTRPDNEPLFQVGALVFRRQDIPASDVSLVERVGDDVAFGPGSASDWLHENAYTPYAARVAKSFVGTEPSAVPSLAPVEGRHDQVARTIGASNGSLQLGYGEGSLLLDAPRLQGVVGQVGELPRSTSRMTLIADPRNPFLAVLVVSLDEAPLESAERLLLVAVARAENSGQAYNATRTALTSAGAAPVRMQGVAAELSLRVGSRSVRPLDRDGVPLAPLSASLEGDALRFRISPLDRTAFYLVE
jgi:hypothetical protein